MSDVWDGREDRDDGGEGESYSTSAFVNGATVELTSGASFKDTVKSLATNARFGKFRVFLNGSEVTPSNAPANINEGDRLEVHPYDVAGKAV